MYTRLASTELSENNLELLILLPCLLNVRNVDLQHYDLLLIFSLTNIL